VVDPTSKSPSKSEEQLEKALSQMHQLQDDRNNLQVIKTKLESEIVLLKVSIYLSNYFN